MNDYTPDEEQVREQYTQEQPPQVGSVAEKRAEFDRFLAKVKADAWDNGYADGQTDHEHTRTNPYRRDER